MTVQNRATLKSYFETGDFPTQAQFEDLIDSMPNIVDNDVLLESDPTITAHAGGGQANAYQLTKLVNNVSVCASPNDSVKVPASGAGAFFFISNATANTVQIFPQSGGSIDALGANNPFNLATGKKAVFATVGGNIWASISSS